MEVRRGPLRSRAGRGAPARKEEKEEGEGRSRASDIESNNPHLAGGEKTQSNPADAGIMSQSSIMSNRDFYLP